MILQFKGPPNSAFMFLSFYFVSGKMNQPINSLPMNLETFTYGFKAMRFLQNKFAVVLKLAHRRFDY